MPRSVSRIFLGIAATLAMGLLAPAGWAASPEQAADAAPESQSLEALKKRVLAYWHARVAKDYRAEYALLEPRLRARVPADEYGRGRTMQYLAAQVESVERRGNFARVGVRLLVKVIIPPLPIPQAATVATPDRTAATLLQDHWVSINGVWYRSQEADVGVPTPWPVAAQ